MRDALFDTWTETPPQAERPQPHIERSRRGLHLNHHTLARRTGPSSAFRRLAALTGGTYGDALFLLPGDTGGNVATARQDAACRSGGAVGPQAVRDGRSICGRDSQ